jgi:hypothetical protein
VIADRAGFRTVGGVPTSPTEGTAMTSQTTTLDELHDDTPVVLAGCPRGSQDALGHPRGVHIGSMNALDLLHRTVLNAYGAAFHVSGLTLDATTGAIVIDLLGVDEDDEPIPGTEVGILSLDGWQVL